MNKNKSIKNNVGIERKLDDLGRLVIPKEMRNQLNFGENERLSILLFENHIEIRKAENICVFCKGQQQLKTFKNYTICESCIEEMANQL